MCSCEKVLERYKKCEYRHRQQEEKANFFYHIFRLTGCYPFTSDFGNITLTIEMSAFKDC